MIAKSLQSYQNLAQMQFSALIYVFMKVQQSFPNHFDIFQKQKPMTRKINTRNNFFTQTSKSHRIIWPFKKTTQSQNLLRSIMEIQFSQERQAESLNNNQECKKEEILNQESKQSQSEQHYVDFQSPKYISNTKIDQNKLKLNPTQDQNQYPEILRQFLESILKRAQKLNCDIKKIKGLCPQKEFVLENVHACQYCGKKFSKPCSLGGHISKLHTKQKNKEKESSSAQERDCNSRSKRG